MNEFELPPPTLNQRAIVWAFILGLVIGWGGTMLLVVKTGHWLR